VCCGHVFDQTGSELEELSHRRKGLELHFSLRGKFRSSVCNGTDLEHSNSEVCCTFKISRDAESSCYGVSFPEWLPRKRPVFPDLAARSLGNFESPFRFPQLPNCILIAVTLAILLAPL